MHYVIFSNYMNSAQSDILPVVFKLAGELNGVLKLVPCWTVGAGHIENSPTVRSFHKDDERVVEVELNDAVEYFKKRKLDQIDFLKTYDAQ